MRRLQYLPLIEQFLKNVQNQNISAVNEALNEILINNDDHETLRSSVVEYDNFDHLTLAKKLESHSLLEFRRISALLYRKNKKWAESIKLSQQDSLYKVILVYLYIYIVVWYIGIYMMWGGVVRCMYMVYIYGIYT